MRTEILKLKDLGRMPNESLDDSEGIDGLINTYDALLGQVAKPISLEEGRVLIQIFPENAFYDLHWDLLKLIESLIKMISEDEYIQLINTCPSTEWKETLNTRFTNYRKQQH